MYTVDGVPYCERYGDYYFSRKGGYAESRYVFLEANALPKRAAGKNGLTVAETGFGTGLNFFTLLEQMIVHDISGCRLEFFSVEKYPLNADWLIRFLTAQFPDLRPDIVRVSASLDSPVKGVQTVFLSSFPAVLRLFIGDVADFAQNITMPVDAFFFDGFDPGKNPDMWSLEVLRSLAEKAAPGATFATYTASSAVRRNLIAAGFEVRKKAGFGKREMMFGSIGSG